jgi:nucleoside-diphosphate-sugar epimerase
MKKVLVLGGSGFLGHSICNQLNKAKYAVTSFQRSIPIKRIFNVKYKKVDLKDLKTCLKRIRDFDYVINSSAILNGENQKKIFINNFKIFFYPFLSCIENKIKNYNYISSNNVVSDNFFLEIIKKKNLKIINGYTLAKLYAEFFLGQYSRKNNILCKIIRPSNLYGQGLLTGVIYFIVSKIKSFKKKVLKLNLNNNSQRNFSHVDDTAGCIINLMKLKKNITCNITNDKVIEIGHIAETCKKLLNKNILIKYNNKKKFSQKIFKVNNLRRTLKWKDSYDLNFGIHYILKSIKR